MNNTKQPNSFEELGYIYFGPLLYNFFVWLKTEAVNVDKIFFNSREGFFLQKIYNQLQQKYSLPESLYFKTSRKLSSIAACNTREDIYKTFEFHRYYGKLSNLLINRFGINPKIDSDYLLDTQYQIPNLDKFVDEILHNSSRLRDEYGKYIIQMLGNSKNVLMVDSGYQGTTQYYIQKAYGLTFKGRYITFKGNSHLTDANGLYDFNATRFPANIIFFESVFIDKVGTYVDVHNGKFINEPINKETQFFKEKEQILNGILNYMSDETITSLEYADYVFNLMCTKGFIKKEELMNIFYHDNYYTRDSIRKVIC